MFNLDKVSYASWGPEDDPLIHSDGLLVLIFLDGDVPPKEKQRERGHLCAVVQEDLRGTEMSLAGNDGSITTD